MRLLLTRPEADSKALARRLQALGHEVLVAPLLSIETLPVKPELSEITDLVFTSSNGVRSFAEASPRRDLRVWAVGEATAASAAAAGFGDIRTAAGDAAALLELIRRDLPPGAAQLLHPSGLHAAGDLEAALTAAGYRARRLALYEAVAAKEFPAYVRAALAGSKLDAVLFFSPRTVRVFVCLAERERLAAACAGIKALCLSKAVAEAAAALEWAEIAAAERPDMNSLLALLERCAGQGR
jgi:uroporphyrinogen-III synthase